MKIKGGPFFRFPGGKANTKRGMGLRQQPRSVRDENGSAVLIVFIVLTLMVAYLISNGRVLYHLQEEIRLINRQHLQTEAPLSLKR